MAFDDIEYQLLPNVKELEETIRTMLKENKLKEYSSIWITDLALYDPALTMIAESSIKEKILVFDHHKKSIDDNMNRYSFTKIVEENEGGRVCGTSLFYDYLKQNNLISSKKTIEKFVELTRLEDTWEWKKNDKMGQEAHDLAILFNILGKETYLTTMLSKLSSHFEPFELSENEKRMIQEKKEDYDNLSDC